MSPLPSGGSCTCARRAGHEAVFSVFLAVVYRSRHWDQLNWELVSITATSILCMSSLWTFRRPPPALRGGGVGGMGAVGADSFRLIWLVLCVRQHRAAVMDVGRPCSGCWRRAGDLGCWQWVGSVLADPGCRRISAMQLAACTVG